MSATEKRETFMRAALAEARKALGQTSPNPAVGAILTSKGRIISRGHHRGAGKPHAEIECLNRLKKSVPSDAVLYVTLEPCSTVGRTGACTDAIIRAGIRQIVVGAIDPNPEHNGRGIRKLRDSGTDVVSGVLAEECASLNEGFNKWITTGLPFVIAKCGMTLDGRLTLPPRGGRWVTSAAARRDAQELRRTVDAIIVGGETVRKDNPRLTIRPAGKQHQPWRVVLTKSGELSRRSNLFQDRFKDRTLVYRNKPLEAVLRDLGRKGVLSVLVEGGGEILGQILDRRLIDKVQLYVAPVFAGGPVIAFAGTGAESTQKALRLEKISYALIGQVLRVTGYAGANKSE
jgi:diaminohydroxyphosphoribosylaminopyrimidine deaminase/5-amino-6-(5-phosphoribosylamino)uracil reductase